jgi:acetyl esterase/lipase
MAYALDPEIAAIFTAMAEQGISLPVPPRGDWRALRDIFTASMEQGMSANPLSPDVQITSFSTKTQDDTEIELRWYVKKKAPSGPAVVYAHGAGMILGSALLYDPVVSEYVAATGVPFLSVDYRLAPEVRGTTLAEDTFAGLSWLITNASRLKVDTARIAIMGDSAGGGIAAGTAILARDRGISLARQILIYPMLDDGNFTPDPTFGSYTTWTFDNNFTGWSSLLGDELGSDTVSPVAVPARLNDFTGLAPAYVEVGELDIFRNEDIAYAHRLATAGIPVELHVHAGAPHGFERMAPHSQVAQRAMADRIRTIKSI